MVIRGVGSERRHSGEFYGWMEHSLNDARDKHGECGVHGARPDGADGMRGDGVGIGHVGALQGRAGGIGDAAGGGHIWGAIW